jgi:hypothetical protein
MTSEARESGALLPNQFEVAKKSDKGAVPAMDAATGDKLWVKPTGAKQPDTRGRKKKDEAGRRAEFERRRIQRTAAILARVISELDENLVFHKDAVKVLTQYALQFGVQIAHESTPDMELRVKAFAKKPFTEAELWEAVSLDMTVNLDRMAKRPTNEPALELNDLEFFAWMVDADLKALKAQADEEIPLPVSLGGPGKPRSRDHGDGPVVGGEETEDEDNFHGMPED